ncbi:baseplate assembly protein [Bosea sp. 2KB_26]|uniref:baseplate assembly protein n=1 Tax=Bosea sp. 2KB_26 TaxID=3237475 RepID=UPI003F8FF875
MRVGLNRRTGEVLMGWDHCVQSMAFIIRTRLASLIMLREFGSLVPELQDRNATPRRIMQVYAAIAAALKAWEPGFRLRQIRLTRFGPDGAFGFLIEGIFYPNGHVGDYSVSETKEAMLAVNDNGIVAVAA